MGTLKTENTPLGTWAIVEGWVSELSMPEHSSPARKSKVTVREENYAARKATERVQEGYA